MQTLIVVAQYSFGRGVPYPALQGMRLSKKAVQGKLDHLKECGWDIAEHRIVTDQRTRADEERDYRAMCRAERLRGA